MTGPLEGLRIVELAGVGPGPYAAMLLSDLGAEVVRVERPTGSFQPFANPGRDFTLRGRTVVQADLRNTDSRDAVLRLIEEADILIEGFRPGVAEKLGVGPERATSINPGLIYARMTGWGQAGPWRDRAGHDINYISVTGALNAIRTAGARPTAPLNLVGDYGGGAMFLVLGVLAALWERQRSGQGQVIDAAMVDGVTSLLQQFWSLRGAGNWSTESADNLLDSGAPFYDTYLCSDGRYIALGAIEPQFFAQTLSGLALDPALLDEAGDRARWPHLRQTLAERFKEQTRDHWASVFEGVDACVTPVLSFEEAVEHPHLRARASHIAIDGVTQSAVAPRFSRTTPMTPRPPGTTICDIADILARWKCPMPTISRDMPPGAADPNSSTEHRI